MTFPIRIKDLTLFLILVFTIISGIVPAQSQFDSKNFYSYIQEATKDWNVPGLSIAVVKDDSIVFLKAYGVRKIGEKEQVDASTLQTQHREPTKENRESCFLLGQRHGQ